MRRSQRKKSLFGIVFCRSIQFTFALHHRDDSSSPRYRGLSPPKHVIQEAQEVGVVAKVGGYGAGGCLERIG